MALTVPFRREYEPGLAHVRGWLLFFYIHMSLTILAFLRVSLAAVVTALPVGRYDWIMALVLLVAMIGLLRRKAWAYYLFLLAGIFHLVRLSIGIIAAPGQMLVGDWMFDTPALGEWVITLAWVLYFLYSKRLYSVVFGART